MKKTDKALLIIIFIIVFITLILFGLLTKEMVYYKNNKYKINSQLSDFNMPYNSLLIFRTGLSSSKDNDNKASYVINNQGDLKLKFNNFQDNSHEFLSHEKLLISGNLEISQPETDKSNNLYFINNNEIASIKTSEDKILRDLSLSPAKNYLKYESYQDGDISRICVTSFNFKETGECDDIYSYFKDSWNWKEYIVQGEWLADQDIFVITINHYQDSLNETEKIVLDKGLFKEQVREVFLPKYKPTKVYYYYPKTKEMKAMPVDTQIFYKTKNNFLNNDELYRENLYNMKDIFDKKNDHHYLNNGDYSIMYDEVNNKYILKEDKTNKKAELISLNDEEDEGVDIIWFDKITLNPFDY